MTIAPGNGVIARGRSRPHVRSATRFTASHARSAAKRRFKCAGSRGPEDALGSIDDGTDEPGGTGRIEPLDGELGIDVTHDAVDVDQLREVAGARETMMHAEVHERIDTVEGERLDPPDADRDGPIEEFLRLQPELASRARQPDHAPVEIYDGVPVVERHLADTEVAEALPVPVAVLEAGSTQCFDRVGQRRRIDQQIEVVVGTLDPTTTTSRGDHRAFDDRPPDPFGVEGRPGAIECPEREQMVGRDRSLRVDQQLGQLPSRVGQREGDRPGHAMRDGELDHAVELGGVDAADRHG